MRSPPLGDFGKFVTGTKIMLFGHISAKMQLKNLKTYSLLTSSQCEATVLLGRGKQVEQGRIQADPNPSMGGPALLRAPLTLNNLLYLM